MNQRARFQSKFALLSIGSVAIALRVAAAEPVARAPPRTATPIQYLVVLFQENVSFDHYFATYPKALNPVGEPRFSAFAATPSVNGLSGPLLTRNPNTAAPFRLGRERAATCDQDHEYTAEQRAYHAGLVDAFVPLAGAAIEARDGKTACHPEDVMGYFDGNTVTALWNYAQHYALSDAHFGSTFGPSTPGALNLIAGQTHGANGYCSTKAPDASCVSSDDAMATQYGTDIVAHSIVNDPQPYYDDCSGREMAAMTGPNIGLRLSAEGVSWGFFQGGFRATQVVNGLAVCGAAHEGSNGVRRGDYIPHHEPFQYFEATANPHHVSPSRPELIGVNGDGTNHQYDLDDFWVAAQRHHLPRVSFLKAPAYLDGHAGYSDPVAEQRYLVATINRLQRLPQWRSMAIIIAYDDSDGWYDHVMPPIVRGSSTAADALDSAGHCGVPRPGDTPGRCGLGPRLPLLVISPYARQNFVDHGTTETASILRFIEDNWRLGRLGGGAADADAGSLEPMFDFTSTTRAPRLRLNPETGQLKIAR